VNGLLPLVAHSLRRRRGFLITMVLMLAGFQFFMILVARDLEQSGRFQAVQALMPDFVAQWTNMVGASFRGIVLFGYSHPIVQLFLVAIAISIGTEPAGEVESKFIDLLMARPVARPVIVARSLIVLLLVTATAIGTMWTASVTGLRLFAPSTAQLPSGGVVFSLAAGLGLVTLAWGSIALAIASWSTRRATASAVCGFAAFAAFVLDYVGKFWDKAEPASTISPFHYFDPFRMIGGEPLHGSDVASLALFIVVAAAVAYVAYARRDL